MKKSVPLRRFMTNGKQIATTILSISLVIVVASVAYSSYLARQLAAEEQKRIEIWAEATRQLILADENTDIDFVSSIIEGNTTIPVYMTDTKGNVLLTRNVRHPKQNPTELSDPIEVRISDEVTQYIYYDESTLLRQLRYFPYLQFALIFLFIVVAVVTLVSVNKNEQDRVWVGMSKETAHQLGTPISSLNGWYELLKQKYPKDELIPQMKSDIERLGVIADRFSKVGSEPDLTDTDLIEVIHHAAEYMRSRISSKVEIKINEYATNARVMLNAPLFEWVIENLTKNAVDAMNGTGVLTIHVFSDADYHYVDISDTGHGIDKRNHSLVFQPGYTTKQRGWGLGLSLSKRIIENYHHGKIWVLHSAPEQGTTFRIKLQRAAEVTA